MIRSRKKKTTKRAKQWRSTEPRTKKRNIFDVEKEEEKEDEQFADISSHSSSENESISSSEYEIWEDSDDPDSNDPDWWNGLFLTETILPLIVISNYATKNTSNYSDIIMMRQSQEEENILLSKFEGISPFFIRIIKSIKWLLVLA